MGKALILLITLLIGVGGYFLFFQKSESAPKAVIDSPSISPEKVNIVANFDIYTNGTRRVFTDPRYHNLSTDVFIEPSSPNTVHIKKLGVTWDDFFKTLPMTLTKECLITGTKQTFCAGEEGNLKFYVNDMEDPDALDKVIKEGDRLLVRYGK